MKRLLALAALLTLALSGAAAGGHARAAGNAVRSSRLVDGGHIRITAIIRTPAQIGRPLDVTFRVRNISNSARRLQLDYPTSFWLVARSPDGTTYDTRKAYWATGSLGGGIRFPTTLRPGQTVTKGVFAPPVQWSGSLRVTPGWDTTPLPAVRVRVATPGAAPSSRTAMADVIAKTGHLLDACTPAKPGVAVTGELVAPEHSAPPLHVACSIRLHREQGFVRAQVLVVSPPRLRVHFERPYEQLSWLKPGRNATAVGWLFVVTRAGAISVGASSVDSTKKARGGAPTWQWTTSGFQPQSGGAKCGGYGAGGGGYGGPLVEFVSKCR